MSSSDVHDLLVRARRNLLSTAEKRHLDAALDAAPETRLLLRAGRAFDAEASALPGDDELVSRLAHRAEARSSARATPLTKSRRRAGAGRIGAGLAAAISLLIGAVAGVAVAATFLGMPLSSVVDSRSNAKTSVNIQRRGAAEPRAAAPAEAAELPSSPSPARVAPDAAMATFAPVTTRSAPVGPATTASARASAGHATTATATRAAAAAALRQTSNDEPSLPDTPAASAAELYSVANQARVRGDLAGAIRGYEELQARFPISAEATASRLTLGNIYLVSGRPLQALAQFRLHQAAGGGGFGAESLWGIATALGQLERRAEEREALTSLLSRYPASPYDAAARRKLQERD